MGVLQKTMIKLKHDTEAAVVKCNLAALQPLVDAGAFPDCEPFHDLGDCETICDMVDLQRRGLVTSEGLGEGAWLLTQTAVNTYLEQSMWLCSVGSAFAVRPDSSICFINMVYVGGICRCCNNCYYIHLNFRNPFNDSAQ